MQGDTSENVTMELECVIKTGTFTFYLGKVEELGRTQSHMLLEYEPASTRFHTDSNEMAKPLQMKPHMMLSGKSKEIWNQEQIEDFVRKLGFLDKDKKNEENIKHFLYLNQVILTFPHILNLCLIFSFISFCIYTDCS